MAKYLKTILLLLYFDLTIYYTVIKLAIWKNECWLPCLMSCDVKPCGAEWSKAVLRLRIAATSISSVRYWLVRSWVRIPFAAIFGDIPRGWSSFLFLISN